MVLQHYDGTRNLVVLSAMILVLMFGVCFASYNQPPHQFYGYFNGTGAQSLNASDIEVRSDNVTVSIKIEDPDNFDYSIQVLNLSDGSPLEFYVQGRFAVNSTFSSLNSTRLDLPVNLSAYCGDGICNDGETCTSCSKDCGECPTTRSTSSGGGGGSPRPQDSDDSEENATENETSGSDDCEPNWYCGFWSECEDGVKTRNCIDRNNCNTTEDKPETTAECNEMGSEVEINITENATSVCGDEVCDGNETCETCPEDCGECDSGFGWPSISWPSFGLTGLFSGTSADTIFWGVMIVLLLVLVYILYKRGMFRRRTRSDGELM